MTVCSTCNDTHAMTLDGAIVMCTRCPVPCQKCREGGTGPYCAITPCPCSCHRNIAAELDALLKEAGARPTFDRARDVTHPCVVCGTVVEPRELVTIGMYTRRMDGGLQPGDPIERPMCKRCEELTR